MGFWRELDRAGADLRLISSLVNLVRFSLIVAPGINSAADLKGGVMAVSGFGSERLGHVCLLNLRDQTYPGSDETKTKGWPTWTTPLMRWAKMQGAYTGYAHSASGLGINPNAAAARKMSELDGKTPDWGYTESVLVDGDQVVCTPGGGKGAMAAFDKKDGKTLWQSKDWTDGAQYASIVKATINGEPQTPCPATDPPDSVMMLCVQSGRPVVASRQLKIPVAPTV